MGPEGAQGARRAPLPWALGPEALRAGEPEKNKERHYGVTSPLRCDLAPLKGRGGCAATRSRMIFQVFSKSCESLNNTAKLQ